MAPKDIVFSPNAERDLKKLNRSQQKKVFDALERWRSKTGKPEIEKIKTQPDFYRLRAGDYRVVYYPLSKERVVLLMIRDRKEVYRGLGDLTGRLDTALKKLRLAR